MTLGCRSPPESSQKKRLFGPRWRKAGHGGLSVIAVATYLTIWSDVCSAVLLQSRCRDMQKAKREPSKTGTCVKLELCFVRIFVISACHKLTPPTRVQSFNLT